MLCAGLLAMPPYLSPAADLLYLAPPTAGMWLVILAFSLALLIVVQAIIVAAGYRAMRKSDSTQKFHVSGVSKQRP